MTPEQAYDWLAPKLSTAEREALDVIFAALPRAPLAQGASWSAKDLPQQPQRQDSTMAQLRDVRDLANRAGCYDAADVLRHVLEAAR